MEFITDQQTLEDLNLLGKYKGNSVFHLFDRTYTGAGEKALEQMFRHPLTEAETINQRSAVFAFFCKARLPYVISGTLHQAVTDYLSEHACSHWGVAFLTVCRQKVVSHVFAGKQFESLCQGVKDTVQWLKLVDSLNEQLAIIPGNEAYLSVIEEVNRYLHTGKLKDVLLLSDKSSLSFLQIVRYDYIFRTRCRVILERLMEIMALTDVYISVASLANEKKWCFAKAVASGKENFIEVHGLVHPCLKGAVSNSLRIDEQRNVVFLTGANMAGKSTLMKAFAIAVYLAHMGFPVPASYMEFVVRDGLFTSVNLPDSIRLGYSHFYAEVMRVRQVAMAVSQKKNLLVIFDELFKGTNVKDAYDATLAVTEAFAAYRNCNFIISTHILEVGETLKKRCPNIQFRMLRTFLQGSKAIYTYQLEEGITHDRHGMMIIQNEHILDMLYKRMS